MANRKADLPSLWNTKPLIISYLIPRRAATHKAFKDHQTDADDQRNECKDDDYLDRSGEERDKCNKSLEQVNNECEDDHDTAYDPWAFKNWHHHKIAPVELYTH